MDLFNFIKDNIEIIDVVSEYTSLKKTGSQYWKGLCPFHHEKTPSFTVSPHKKIFYCFGCHETGDVISFIEKTENISAIEAVKHLAQRFQLDLPEDTQLMQEHKKNSSVFQVWHIVAQWCNDKLLKNKYALDYLQERHISKTVISKFCLGYFPSGSNTINQLIALLLQQGYSSKDLMQENILFQGKGNMYSPFENRIIFPIKDHLGQICAFGGRIFKPEDQRVKYYNSKETPHFKKGKMVFGLDIAKHEIQKQKTVFIVEGYTDCIAMHQHGYTNTVATLGTACSTEHLIQLHKHAQTIYLMYDSDSAGKQAMIRIAQSCWQLDMELKVITLPKNQDPASMLEQNISIEPYIQQAVDIFTFFLQTTGSNFATLSIRDKLASIHELLAIISNFEDVLKQNILLMKASENLQVPLDILKKEYNNRKSTTKPTMQDSQQIGSKPVSQDPLEQQILAAILHDVSLLDKKYERLLLEQFSQPAKTIFKKIIDASNDQTLSSFDAIKEILTPEEWKYAQATLFTIETSNLQRTFQNLMVQFQKKHWKSIISHIKIKLLQAKKEHNTAEVKELLDVFEKIKKDIYTGGRL